MNHLEKLIRQYYEWQGYIVRRNIKVEKLAHGGWGGELDIVAYHPQKDHLIHLEPSIDAHSWKKREERFSKKFKFGRDYIYKDVFPWLNNKTKLEQVAVLITSSHKELAGCEIISIDELIKEIKLKIKEQGLTIQKAIPEEFDLLRTIQMTECGYSKVL